MSDRVIHVDGLTKRFGSFTAVDHISFDVKRGEIFGFLGANGAGKTTAMRMLCGLLDPTEGNADVAGFNVLTQAEEVKKHIGYMSQKFSMYEDLTVKENFEFYGGVYRLSQKTIKERLGEMLARLGLDHIEKTLVHDIPLGWKQKLSFSLALLHRPGIIFLDEPTGGVDPITRRQFWEMIYEAAADGVTIFVTTHYMDEAEYCDRVSIMVDGRISALDSPENLRKEFKAQTMDEVFRQLARGAKNAAG
ncbi:MAG: ABC transporter ATP-binding protein [Flavobacteriales bacterium]|nr:ABC transporter ATP-binding protein [Flavobacteriales bacterium]